MGHGPFQIIAVTFYRYKWLETDLGRTIVKDLKPVSPAALHMHRPCLLAALSPAASLTAAMTANAAALTLCSLVGCALYCTLVWKVHGKRGVYVQMSKCTCLVGVKEFLPKSASKNVNAAKN